MKNENHEPYFQQNMKRTSRQIENYRAMPQQMFFVKEIAFFFYFVK